MCAGPGAASASEGNRVTIKNDHSYLCMSLPGDVVVAGARIDQWTCGGYPDQYWYINPSSSHPGWFYIQPAQDDTLCATYVPQSDANLTLQSCGVNAANGNFSTQLWYYNTANANDELETVQGWAMSVPGASFDPNTNINTWPYGRYPDQFWRLYSA
jgi:hypothetical protein